MNTADHSPFRKVRSTTSIALKNENPPTTSSPFEDLSKEEDPVTCPTFLLFFDQPGTFYFAVHQRCERHLVGKDLPYIDVGVSVYKTDWTGRSLGAFVVGSGLDVAMQVATTGRQLEAGTYLVVPTSSGTKFHEYSTKKMKGEEKSGEAMERMVTLVVHGDVHYDILELAPNREALQRASLDPIIHNGSTIEAYEKRKGVKSWPDSVMLRSLHAERGHWSLAVKNDSCLPIRFKLIVTTTGFCKYWSHSKIINSGEREEGNDSSSSDPDGPVTTTFSAEVWVMPWDSALLLHLMVSFEDLQNMTVAPNVKVRGSSTDVVRYLLTSTRKA